MDRFFKLQKKPLYLGMFIPRKMLCIDFDKNWVGTHFGRCFKTNSSGHPGCREQKLNCRGVTGLILLETRMVARQTWRKLLR
jgi:hypothetical protein